MARRRIRVATVVVAAFCCLVTTSCLRFDVGALASDDMDGRGAGTTQGATARGFLIDRLSMYAEPLRTDVTGDEAYEQRFTFPRDKVGTNILGVVRGSERPDEYVIVGAHYDHMAAGACSKASAADSVCNGATDNATGAAAILELAKRLAAEPAERSVVFALWDAEEVGKRGSTFYVANPLVPKAATVAYLNLDIVGQNLLPSLRDTTFLVGAETGGPLLQEFADLVAAGSDLDVEVLHEVFGRDRSDHQPFLDHGIPAMFLGDSTGSCYHEVGDEVAIVDFGKLARQIDLVEQLVRPIADAVEWATFTAPTGIPRFRDAAAISDVLQRSVSDIALFPTDRQPTLNSQRTRVATIVAEGPEAFGLDDAQTVGGAASTALNYTALLDCNGFLADG